MSADPNKKTARTFQCRDVLWEAFEQMSRDLECSVDYLINESMKQYARQRGHGVHRTPFPAQRTPQGSGRADDSAKLQPVQSKAVRPAASALTDSAARMPPPPAPPAAGRAASLAERHPLSISSSSTERRSQVIPPIPRIPPPLPFAQSAASPPAAPNGVPAAAGRTLSLVYHGERYPITKDRFVIGRGRQSSDLTLRDPNVSRQHALIEAQDGAYFMVDMGSTNGVTFNGQRVARKPIVEGDVFHICDHELVFTYQ
jgi:hypothetical protein